MHHGSECTFLVDIVIGDNWHFEAAKQQLSFHLFSYLKHDDAENFIVNCDRKKNIVKQS